MKLPRPTSTVCALALLSIACHGGHGTFRGMHLGPGSFASEDDGTTKKITWNEGGTLTHVRVEGDVEFTPDDADVASIAGAGTMRIESEGRVIELREEGEELARTLHVDGIAQEWGAQADTLLASIIATLIERSTVGALPRAQRILENDGPAGLVAAISAVKSSSAQRIYADELLGVPNLGTDTLAAATRATEHVSSDSTRASILIGIAAHAQDDAGLTGLLLKTTSALSSSSNQREVFESIARERALTSDDTIAAMRASKSISSTSARTQTLQAFLQAGPTDARVHDAYIQATRELSSSSAQSEAYAELLARDDVSTATRANIARAATSISSASSRSQLITRLISEGPADNALFAACLDTIAGISSTSGKVEPLEALLARKDLSKATLERMTAAVRDVSSASARSKLQDALLRRMTE